MNERLRFLLTVTFCSTAFAGAPAPKAPPAGGQWQGAPSVRAQTRPAGHTGQPRFLVLNTGGTGGSFGQGDLRFGLQSLSFLTRTTGWAAGAAGAFVTNDGGLTWQRSQPRPSRPDKGIGFYQIRMAGPEEVWLLEGQHPGGPGKAWLWHTRDGGRTWEELLPGRLRGYRGLCVAREQLWTIGNHPPLLHSRDNGNTWEENACGGLLSELWRLEVVGSEEKGGATIYLLGASAKRWPYGQLIRSGDGGKTWAAIAFPDDTPQAFPQYQMFFLNPYRGWLGLPGGRIVRTTDGGATWSTSSLPGAEPRMEIRTLWFDQLGRGLVAIVNPHHRVALYYSPDDGAHWFPTVTGQKQINAIASLGPLSAGEVWAVGDVPGLIYNDLVLILTNSPASGFSPATP